MLYRKYKINVEEWLKNYHTFTELQVSSCAKLVYIFGPDINLYAGDSLMLKHSTDKEQGILFFNEAKSKWENDSILDKLIHLKLVRNSLKLLIFIFENRQDKILLKKLLIKLEQF